MVGFKPLISPQKIERFKPVDLTTILMSPKTNKVSAGSKHILDGLSFRAVDGFAEADPEKKFTRGIITNIHKIKLFFKILGGTLLQILKRFD